MNNIFCRMGYQSFTGHGLEILFDTNHIPARKLRSHLVVDKMLYITDPKRVLLHQAGLSSSLAYDIVTKMYEFFFKYHAENSKSIDRVCLA